MRIDSCVYPPSIGIRIASSVRIEWKWLNGCALVHWSKKSGVFYDNYHHENIVLLAHCCGRVDWPLFPLLGQ